MTYQQQLDSFMPDVAKELLGEPNGRLSRPDRGVFKFGSNGSLEVNTGEGWFNDYEANVKGGVLDLLRHKGGCPDQTAAFKWLEAKGIKQPTRAEAKFYDYRNEAGTVLFRVERKVQGDKKTFLQHGPDGSGGFVCRKGCMQGVRRVLYNLPALAKAAPDQLVFVCEGEKDVDRLTAANLLATCNPGGAGKFLPEFAPALRGRSVVILEDNDEGGRAHAADVLAKLDGIAGQAAVLRLPDLPSKGDVSDWLDRGGTVAELAVLAEKALNAPPELPLPVLDLADLAGKRAPVRQFVIQGFAPAGELTLFTGPGGAGKSLLGQQLATAAVAGMATLGLSITPGPALLVTCEDGEEELWRRQEAICRAMGVDMASLAGKLYLASLRGDLDNALLARGENGEAVLSQAYQRLEQIIRVAGAKLVFLDNVAHLFTGNENDRADVTAFVNVLNRLAGETGAAIILIGHPPKPSKPDQAGHTYSGSTAWLNAVRSHFTIDYVREPDGTILDPDLRAISTGKANYARGGEAVRFRWHDWAYVLESDLPADMQAELAQAAAVNAENAAFLACLRERATQGEGRGVGPSTGPNYAPTQFEGMAQAKGFKKATLKKAMDRLFSVGAIESYTYRNTAKGRDVTIVREVPEATPNAVPNASRTLPPNTPEQSPRTPPRTHPISKDIEGGPAQASPRPLAETDCPRCAGTGCQWCEQ